MGYLSEMNAPLYKIHLSIASGPGYRPPYNRRSRCIHVLIPLKKRYGNCLHQPFFNRGSNILASQFSSSQRDLIAEIIQPQSAKKIILPGQN